MDQIVYGVTAWKKPAE